MTIPSTASISLLAAVGVVIRDDDPLPPIGNVVDGLRGQSQCAALTYRSDLDGAAQRSARSANEYRVFTR